MQTTKLSAFCDKLIEAGLWAVIVSVPLFFNLYSSKVFELNKIALLRAMVLTMLLAWLVRMLETRQLRSAQALRLRSAQTWWETLRNSAASLRPAAPALIFLGAYLLATVTSIAPRLSFWGSYGRLEGFYTTLCYVLLFLLALYVLRRPTQLFRLVTITLLTSLPVVLYAIAQRYGLDPFQWADVPEVTYRVISTVGNPIFLGAYLIMIIPLTIGRLGAMLSHTLSEKSLRPSRLILAGYYALLLGLQITVLFFTQSRGPFLGFAGGMFFLALLWATVKGKRKPILLLLAVVGALVLLMLLIRPDALLAPRGELPDSGRTNPILEVIPRAYYARTIQQRILMWEGVSDIMAVRPTRALSGYGPETFTAAFYLHFPPDLAPYIASVGKELIIDRPHNQVLYTLVTTGFIGLAAYLALLGSVFYFGLKRLGLIATGRQRTLFLALWGMGALLGLLVPWLLRGSLQFAGLGIPTGALSGLGTFLIISLFKFPKSEIRNPKSEIPTGESRLLIVLLAALIAHFVEQQFGIADPVSQLHFWLYAAIIVASGFRPYNQPASHHPDHQHPSEAVSKSTNQAQKHAKRKARQQRISLAPNISLLLYALAITLMMITLGFAFAKGLLGSKAENLGVTGFLTAVWILLTLIVVGEVRASQGPGELESRDSKVRRGKTRSASAPLPLRSSAPLLRHLWPCLLPVGGFLIFLAFLAPTVRPPGDAANAIVVYFFWSMAAVVGLAVAGAREMAGSGVTWRRSNAWFYFPLIIVALLIISTTNLNLVRGDTYLDQGVDSANATQWEAAIAEFQQASQLAPHYDEPYKLLAQAYNKKWQTASESERDAAWLREAQKALEQAGRIHPLSYNDLTQLAAIHVKLAEAIDDVDAQREHSQSAAVYYQQAAALSPWPADIYRKWGRTYHTLEKYARAVEKYQAALRFDNQSLLTYAYLADTYGAQENWERAIEILEGVIARRPEALDPDAPQSLDPNAVDVRVYLSYAYYKNGELKKAVAEGLKALELDPDNHVVHQNLSTFYEDMGQTDRATAELKRAIELAPPQAKQALKKQGVEEYFAQGQRYLDQNELDKAVEAYTQVLAVDPDHMEAHKDLSYTYYHQGKLEKALAEGLAAIRLAPDDFENYYNVAVIYYKLGQLDEAITQARTALDLAPAEQRPALQDLIAQLESAEQQR